MFGGLISHESALICSAKTRKRMKQNIPGSQLKVIAKAGHFSPWEQAEEVGKLVRQVLDTVSS